MPRQVLVSLFAALTLAACWAGATRRLLAEEPYGRFQFDESERDHWAYLPVKRPAPPAVQKSDWLKNPIDAFVLHELEAKGLSPSSPAERGVLLRRVYFDLIGLPPTLAEQDAFLADTSPDAYTKVVDDLLARPEYGERWARHWLDAVRYAESNGYERDGAKPSAWRYRDYVIGAMNADKPYNRFVTEQLAGDELPDATAETHIATTFLRLGAWDDEPADALVDRYDQLDDIVGTTTAVFMAQTVRCARCHDHKFEAFKQRDYTRMVALFEPIKRPEKNEDLPVGSAAEMAVYREATKEIDARVAVLQTQLNQREFELGHMLDVAGKLGPHPSQLADATGGQTATPPSSALPAEAVAVLRVSPADRNPAQQELIKKHRPAVREALKTLPEAERQPLASLEKEIADAEKSRPQPVARAFVWYEDGQPTPASHIFRRGDPRQAGDEVGPGIPAVLVEHPPQLPATSTDPAQQHSSGRRLMLANWLTDPTNSLTARVMVNRLWQGHFGDGIVPTENDFGIMGQPPTNQELLDWLAAELVEGGWSLKHIQRLIVLSNTYQQSAAVRREAEAKDPENSLLWRYPPRRLEAEAVRDAMLWTSGDLNPARGGPSVYPEIEPAVLAGQSRPGNGWTKSSPHDANRRSVYVFVKRTLVLPELEVLDFPNTNSACEQRLVSTVAPQALTYFNGNFARDQAKHFAKRLATEAGDDAAAQIDRAYRLALSRSPSADERTAILGFLTKQQQQIETEAQAAGKPAADARQQALTAFCLVLLNTNEFVYLK